MDFQIGDIITSYHSGYHQITRIEPREIIRGISSPLIYYKQLLTDSGKRKNFQKERACDIRFCKKASLDLTERINRLMEAQNTLVILEEEIEQAKRKDN